MSATFRAVVSLLGLIGYFVLSVAMFGGVIVGAYLLAGHLRIMWWVIAVTAAIGVAVFVQLFVTLLSRPPLPNGVDVTRQDSPELWSLVSELAGAARTRGPQQIRLVADANARVSEDSRLLGLIGGARRIELGVPLLQGLSVTQLRAVLAHEFGHYSTAHTRLAPIAYRGLQAMAGNVEEMHGANAGLLIQLYGLPLTLYFGLYARVSLAMNRSQEREADRLMVQFAGRANSQAALRELGVIAALLSSYLQYVRGDVRRADLVTTADGFFGGFGQLLADRVDERAALRESVLGVRSSRLDTHPSIAERIAAIEAMPDPASSPHDDDRPATVLLPGFLELAAATAEETQVFGYRERLEWDELAARMGADADLYDASRVYVDVAQLGGVSTATLATVVALSDSGRGAELVEAVSWNRKGKSPNQVVAEVFGALVRAAAVQSGVARWRMNWTGPLQLVTAVGEVFDAGSLATMLANASTARQAAARLLSLGIDVAAVGPVFVAAATDVGKVVGGIADMKVEGARYDVLILEKGLILAERARAAEDKEWHSLSMLVAFGSPAELAAHHRFIPYESMTSAKCSGYLVTKAKIKLADGTKIVLQQRYISECLPRGSAGDVLKQYLKRLGGESDSE